MHAHVHTMGTYVFFSLSFDSFCYSEFINSEFFFINFVIIFSFWFSVFLYPRFLTNWSKFASKCFILYILFTHTHFIPFNLKAWSSATITAQFQWRNTTLAIAYKHTAFNTINTKISMKKRNKKKKKKKTGKHFR